MITVVKRSEAVIRKIAESKIVKNYITKDISPQVSFAITEATDYSEKETTLYNRIYYVLQGHLELITDGEEVSLEVGDTCFVEKDTTYEIRGSFKVVVVNQPAFGS